MCIRDRYYNIYIVNIRWSKSHAAIEHWCIQRSCQWSNRIHSFLFPFILFTRNQTIVFGVITKLKKNCQYCLHYWRFALSHFTVHVINSFVCLIINTFTLIEATHSVGSQIEFFEISSDDWRRQPLPAFTRSKPQSIARKFQYLQTWHCLLYTSRCV